MADLYVMSRFTGKVYRFDGSSWTQFASAPFTWPSAFADPSAVLFVYKGKLHAFTAGATITTWSVHRLESNGTWTALVTGVARARYFYPGGYARYRGKIYFPCFAYGGTQMRLMEWDGSSFTGDNAATAVWSDAQAGGSYSSPCQAGRMVAWRERLLLGQFAVTNLTNRYSNFLYAIDPTAGAGISSQKLLGGPDGTHLAAIDFPANTSIQPMPTINNGVIRTHIGFGTYQGKVYIMGPDGGVRELPPNQAPTPTPIFTFRSAFPVLGPYTADVGTNPSADGLRVPSASGGFLTYRYFIMGAEITCDGRVGICTGIIATAPYTLRLSDPVTDLPIGNFPSGASYTVKQGLIPWYGDAYLGSPTQSFFFEYNGCLYVLICGTQQAGLSGTRTPSILAKWNGVSASFTSILHGGTTLDAAGANAVVDPATGYLHIAYYRWVTDTSLEWRHAVVDLSATTPVVLSTTTFGSESGGTSGITRNQLGDAQVALFTYDRPTAEVTATSYNATQNKMTVTYSLYDDSSNPANITIETDYGTGWFEATRKGSEGEGKTGLTSSPSGVEHTFVHDLGADGSPQVTRIQYKVTASQP